MLLVCLFSRCSRRHSSLQLLAYMTLRKGHLCQISDAFPGKGPFDSSSSVHGTFLHPFFLRACCRPCNMSVVLLSKSRRVLSPLTRTNHCSSPSSHSHPTSETRQRICGVCASPLILVELLVARTAVGRRAPNSVTDCVLGILQPSEVRKGVFSRKSGRHHRCSSSLFPHIISCNIRRFVWPVEPQQCRDQAYRQHFICELGDQDTKISSDRFV